MAVNWKGDSIKAKLLRAQIATIDTTMSAAIKEAKQNHPFQNRSGDLERSVNIAVPARRAGNGAAGRWGSRNIVYARRIELGFQGKDSKGRIVNTRAFPFLIPAASKEYPKLSNRIAREFNR